MFTLAIIGRPNVGKSTLFNRLAGKKLAIVNDTPGITRDWREAEGSLFGNQLRIIDTAGLEESFDDSIEGRMRRQTEAAMAEADAALFLIDGRAGIMPLDEHFARWLRKQKIPVVLGINKCENEKAAQAAIGESYALGLGEPVILSAEHGIGMDLLHDALKDLFPDKRKQGGEEEGVEDILPDLDAIEGDENYDFAADAPEEPEENPIKIAIAGRPNVGKSTLLNALLGSERVMTGPEAGITRDAIAVRWEYKGRPFRLADTAGLRKKAKVVDEIERMSTEDTLRAIRLAQVVILVVDAAVMLEKQDLTIAQHVMEEGRALVIAVNKWDMVEDAKEALQKLRDRLDMSLAQARGVPVVTLSALTGKNVTKIMDAALRAYETWNKRVPTGKMNRWLGMMESRNPAPMVNGRPNRLKYITQVKSRPPTFALWVSQAGDMDDSYKRYLINGLRDDFDLPGVPVRLLVRASRNPYG